MNKSQVTTHAGEIEEYVHGKLLSLGEKIVGSYSKTKTFTIAVRGYPNNDLKLTVYVSKSSSGKVDIHTTYTDEDDGPNDQCEKVACTSLEFKVELLLNWKRIKHEFLEWIDETKKSEKERLERIEQYELELCSSVPTDFEV